MSAIESTPTVVILMGPPGSGKGTQAFKLASELKIPHISTGDMFRNHMKSNTELGNRVRNYLDQGKLVPDQVVIDMLQERILKPDCANGFLLDGFPRTVAQADELKKLLGNKYRLVVLDLQVSDAVVKERISGRRMCPSCGMSYHVIYSPPKKEGICDNCGGEIIQRKDDREEVVQERLNVYHEQTKPLEAYYKKEGHYITIDGEKSPKDVFQECLQAIAVAK